MATGNFYNKNASYIFVGILENEFDYDDLLDNIRYAFNDKPEFGRIVNLEGWNHKDDSRNIVEVYSKAKEYKDFDVSLSMEIVARSGYYEHCNIDWNMYINISGEQFEIDEDVENLLWGYVEGDGMLKRYAGWVQNWIDANKDEFRVAVEKIIADYTTPYGVSARFSNGETWYKKVEKVEF